ncbi:kinase [Hirsutella rhossiliensis]|uniref:Kinase n=1 Tax=Hirsutella rhossiliensis TaxID=111463 RepID=A0A9P8MU52_9HYPO|nr:kinase [Hirsutella rhossiliensis]KAH0961300.1 kinase [Hirsutella rhossiliensis]
MDIFFQMPDREANSTFTYKDVLVVGEQKKSYDASRFKADLLQLTRYVRGVFADQPTRRFVHAFSLSSSKMELWVFDRSGPYSSGLFDIHDEPDKFARALVGYATMNKRKPEVDHLKLAGEKGVKGVARVVAHRQITNIADMRKGLEFPKPHPFRDEDVYFRDLPSAVGSTSTRRRSNSQKPKLAKEIKEQLSIGKTKPSLCTSTGEDPFENRIYSCLVVSPAGRVISDFKTIKELLQSMRDAIRAHQSLYVTGKILHRDVSSNNIIITKPELADGFKGMLIDLDLAKVRDSGPSGARHQTGTMQFMAVEVLREADHTYRHDLESFFYVLIWMCVRESWTKKQFSRGERPPKESLLRRWEVGSFKYIAAAKEGDMTVNRLEEIMGEFPESLDVVKPLCLRIRSIMFGDTARLNFGTPVGDSDQLYKPLVAAYDDTISEL